MRNFKLIFLTFVVFFFIFNFKSYSEVVNKVDVKGNERISIETIVIFGDIELGKNYESTDINLLIKKHYDSGFFSNISVELKDELLTIVVQENPIINSIVYEGEKTKKYREAITELLTLREKSSFIKTYVKSDISIIQELYRSLGFYFVKVEAEIEKLDRKRINLFYSINKGEKARISKIHFLGDKKIRDNRLRSIITSEEAIFWKFISRNVYLNKGRIELDKRLLKNYYRNRGYYEVEITSSNVEYSEGEGFILTYSINAGKRYKFKKVFANVAESLDQSAFISLENEFNKIVGEYYSQKKLTSILEKIDKLSEQKELQFINHRIIETLDGSNVEVKIDIFEGEKFFIERINIAGNNVTNDSVIRGEMLVDEGDPYSVLLVNKSINRIKGRGIFGRVEKRITQGSSPDLKVLEVSVEEKATGEITAGAGIGTDGTSFMFAISENNWLGRGVRLRTSLNTSKESLSGGIAITNPNYNYSGNTVFTSFDLSSTDRTDSSGYESTKTGFELGTEFEQYEDVYLSTTISILQEDIDVQSDSSEQVKKMDGGYFNTDFTYGITFDRRNQSYRPTSGYKTSWTQRLPIIMDSSSILNGIDVSSYYGYSENVIGVLKFHARSIHGLDEDDVRLTSRLFIPPSRLRGFNARRVGPKDAEDWVGGNYTAALGFELQLPNLLPESYKTDFSAFIDTANVWAVDYNTALDDTNKIRSSIGVSANVFTTVGPLSFTLAKALTQAINDETRAFEFRLGTSF